MLLALLTLVTGAHALDCAAGVYDANVRDAVVPQNVQIVAPYAYDVQPDGVWLEDADGEVVATTVEVADQFLTVLPADPLLHPGDYTLRSEWMEARFTVEQGEDLEAPSSPWFEVSRHKDRSEWGTEEGLWLTMGPSLKRGEHFEIEVSTDEDFTQAHTVVALHSEILVGRGLCDATFDDYDRKTDYFVRVRRVDAAGNASSWGREDEGGFMECGMGCNAAGGLGLSGWLAGVLVVAGRRRRGSERGQPSSGGSQSV
jgi:hypothetical protein